jgi:hypothetical protein
MVSGGVGDDLLANSAPETPSKLQQRGSKSGETTHRLERGVGSTRVCGHCANGALSSSAQRCTGAVAGHAIAG